MNLFVSTTFMSDGCRLYDTLEVCLQNGINSVEIGSNHCYEKNYSYLKEFNFEFLMHNYFPIPKNSFVLNIASLDNYIYQRSLNHIKSL